MALLKNLFANPFSAFWKIPLGCLILFSIQTGIPHHISAQSSLFFQNNTDLALTIQITQSGSHTLNPGEWTQNANQMDPWQWKEELMAVQRDTTVPDGDTVYFDVAISAGNDVVSLQFRLDGQQNGSALHYAASGPGFASPWLNDGQFHSHNFTFDGLDVTLKYRPDNDDASQSRNLYFVLHDNQPYDIPQADFQDPDVFNLLAYNIQFLPFVGNDMPDRGDEIPAHIHAYQDAVIIEEAFDDNARENHLEPAMAAAGFPYKTGILNDYFPWNGGVQIFSRWPIETTDMYDFANCGPNAADCFANKGILYARINKLGKRYHVFGTHMDAGSSQADIDVKKEQLGEMRDFVAKQNIPRQEPVLMGGDWNIGPHHSQDLIQAVWDSLYPAIPQHLGFWESNMSLDTGEIIDHIWLEINYLLPDSSNNNILTPRTISDQLWGVSDLSDHRAVSGRFAYPDITVTGTDTLCEGDPLSLAVNGGNPLSRQWQKDGTDLPGETGTGYGIAAVNAADAGEYACNLQYRRIYGAGTDFITPFFYPNGPDTLDQTLHVVAADLTVLGPNCETSTAPDLAATLDIFPNPAHRVLHVRSSETIQTLHLSDLQGRLLRKVDISEKAGTLSLENIARGMYLLKVIQGKFQTVRKIWVE